jgi:hypothetical protein
LPICGCASIQALVLGLRKEWSLLQNGDECGPNQCGRPSQVQLLDRRACVSVSNKGYVPSQSRLSWTALPRLPLLYPPLPFPRRLFTMFARGDESPSFSACVLISKVNVVTRRCRYRCHRLVPDSYWDGVIVLLDSVPPRTLGSEFLALKLDNGFIPRSAKSASTSR